MNCLFKLCCLGVGLLALIVAGGCASSHAEAGKVTVLNEADPVAGELVAFLESRHVAVSKGSDGRVEIAPGAASEGAIIQYMKIARLKMETITANIANVDTTRDADGKPAPYRRRYVEVSEKGEGRVVVDPSPLMKRYDPGHPDAGADGMVLYPNVSAPVETVMMAEASREYTFAAEILRRMDPAIVLGSVDSGEAFEESD